MNTLNKFKRGLAALLSLSVALSAVFVFHFPLMRAYADNFDHEHPVSGNWEEWDLDIKDGLPTQSGYYCLTGDGDNGNFTITKTWEPADGTYLCLNDHKIVLGAPDSDPDSETEIVDSAPVISVLAGRTFTLCDIEGGDGTITHDDFRGGSGVNNSGTFNMLGGSISGNESSENGGGVYNEGTFNMLGGDITGNTAENGGGVYNEGTFNMYGGTIDSNIAYDKGDGVYVTKDKSMTVGGSAYIYDNHSNISNVYLPEGVTINVSDKISLGGEDAKIGIYTEGAEEDDEGSTTTPATNVPISGENDKNYRKFFRSDNLVNNQAPYVIYEDGVLKISLTDPDGEEYTEAVPPVDPEDSEPGKPEPDTSEPDTPSKPDESGGSSDTTPSDSDSSSEPSSSDSSDSDTSSSQGGEDDPKPEPTHSHVPDDGWTWVALDKDNPQTVKGNYFLDDNVPLSDTWKPANGTRLCLNGKTLSISIDKPVISVTGEFTLCDEGGGKITHSNSEGVAVEIESGGSFKIYGGEISGNSNDGVKLTENSGSLIVGGTAKILDVVCLTDGRTITVDKDKPLTTGAKICVRTDPAPAYGTPVAITEKNNGDFSEYFYSELYKVTYDNGVIKLENTVAPPADDKHEPHGGEGDETEWEAVSSEAELRKAESGKHYYLTENITLNGSWNPEENTYLCLNGFTLNGTIGNSNLTLYNCESTGTAKVTVSAGKTITVGGKLKANITLNDGALIDVDSDYALRSGASITVTLGKTLAEGAGEQITTANGGAYSAYFQSGNSSYKKTLKNNGEIWLERPEAPVITHTHPICGDDNCKEHTNITWTEWNSSTTLPSTAGSYYLTRNVTLSSRWTVSSDINLCLNGYIITMNYNDTAVYITDELSLCDCGTRTSAGIITHASNKSGRGVYIAGGAAFTMYGGEIRGNRSENGAGVYNDGTFDMRGGYITSNSASKIGGGLYNNGVATVEGEIFGNTATQKAGGVYQDGKLTVNKEAYIMKNTSGSSGSTKSNVYITDGSRITIGSSFDGEVGITPETNPKSGESVTFAKGFVSSSTVNKLRSDSSSFTVKRSGDTLTLSRKTASNYDDDDDDLEGLKLKAEYKMSIPQADRTAIVNLISTMPTWVVGAYYDVTLYDEEEDEYIEKHTKQLEVKLDIPASIRAANRVYKVIRVHDGEAMLLEDIDNDPNTITVHSRYFSTYAIIYSVAQSAAANGSGANGSGSSGGYGNPAMGVQNDIPIAGLACGFTALALAAPGKKFEQ